MTTESDHPPRVDEPITDGSLPLFRHAAQHQNRVSPQGTIVLIRRVSFAWMAGAAALMSLGIVGFLIWGSYTKRSTLTGQLVPDSGLIKIYPPQFGTIVEKHATEGDVVHRGDVLYVVSSEVISTDVGQTQASISQQLRSRLQSLNDDIARTRILEETERQAARDKLGNLNSQLAAVAAQEGSARARVLLAQNTQARYDVLDQQGYLSKDELLTRQTDLIEQRARLQSLRRDDYSLRQQVADQQTTLVELSSKYQSQIDETQRSIASVEQDLSQSESRRTWSITAPEDGVATAVVGEIGQTVDNGRMLLSIVPLGAKLQAQLYAPSRTVGFVKPGDKVYLRYEAYPYQKFGHASGRVLRISKAASSTSELTGIAAAYTRSDSTTDPSEQVYRVTIDLDAQSVMAYGNQMPLQAGMKVDADVLQETRRLYEWVFEPLLSVTGKLR